MAAVTAFAGAVVTFVWNWLAPRVGLTGTPSLEALARAARTVAQAVVAVGLVAVWDSVYATVTGGNYNPRDIVAGAVTALVMSVVAYAHTLISPAKPEALRRG
jgi:Ni,Fe-hydrogenase I small subunit